ELEHLRRDERLRADDFENRLELRVRGFLGERRDAAKHLARTKRHLDAAAHVHLARQRGRNEVIELLPQRDFESDAGDHGALRVEGGRLRVKRAPADSSGFFILILSYSSPLLV